jgi:Transglycosylase associated protein
LFDPLGIKQNKDRARKQNRLSLDEHVSLCGLTKIYIHVTHHFVHHCRFRRRFDRTRRYAGCTASRFHNDYSTRYLWLDRRRIYRPAVFQAGPGSAFHPAGFILSIIGAIILLFIWAKLAPA